MPAVSLCCRVCATEHPLEATGRVRSASALSTRPTTGTRCARRVSRASIEAGPPSIWRYADLLPVEAPRRRRGSRRV